MPLPPRAPLMPVVAMPQRAIREDTGFRTQHFFLRRVDGTADEEETFALRYQVYCEERGLLPKQTLGVEKETDTHDPHSAHFGAFDSTGHVVGTVRLVRHSEEGFPLETHCKLDEDGGYVDVPQTQMAEISRLAVSKKYRRRAGDGFYGFPTPGSGTDKSLLAERRRKPEIVLGLYKAMYQESKRSGITHWLAAMEKTLVRLLWRFGFVFVPIGPEVDYYGPVTPYMASIAEVERTAFRKNPEVFWDFMEGLDPEYWPDFAR